MRRLVRDVMIQYPPKAPPGFPISVTRLDGHGAPIHSAKPHAHGFFAVLYATSGAGSIRVGRVTLPVSDGSLVVTSPGEIHDTKGLYAVARWGLDFTTDAFGIDAAGWMFPRPSHPEWVVLLRRSFDAPEVIQVPAELRPEWERQFRTMERELAERGHGYREIVRAELTAMLIRTSRLVPGRALTPVSPLLGEVFDAIEARFADHVSLVDVAKAVGRSPAHLTTIVREQTGMTVQQWIIERRMAAARQRLLVSDENVGVLAERVGYRDPTLFIRHFKRAHGVTPRQWRITK